MPKNREPQIDNPACSIGIHLSENRLFVQVDRMRKDCGVFEESLRDGASHYRSPALWIRVELLNHMEVA